MTTPAIHVNYFSVTRLNGVVFVNFGTQRKPEGEVEYYTEIVMTDEGAIVLINLLRKMMAGPQIIEPHETQLGTKQ